MWLSYAQFELQVEHEDRLAQARHVYEQANRELRQGREKEERLMLLEAWRDFESEQVWERLRSYFIIFTLQGDEKSQEEVAQLLPRRVKKRRKIQTEDGSDQGWEEYFDYIFPEDEAAKPNLKLLAMAKMWKKQKAVGSDSNDVEEESRKLDGMEDEQDEVVEDAENPDADDPKIANESSSESEEEEGVGAAKRQKVASE